MQPNIDRLRVLAEVILPSVNDSEFTIHHWKCESAACAVGYALTHPPFNQLGFTLIENTHNQCGDDQRYAPQYTNPETGEVLHSWKAVKEFFGLTEDEATYLFHSSSYSFSRNVSKTRVTDRILKFIEEQS